MGKQKLTHLSLFSGIGGLDIAAEWAGFETAGQCEWADYPTRVLEKHWPDVPRWRDVRNVTGASFRDRTGCKDLTILSGGFPCQPHSLAGKRLASGDERDLWGEFARCVREIEPGWVLGENVPGLLSSEAGRFFGRILRDLAEMGYHAGWCCFPAHAVGSDFWGERVFLVAASDRVRRNGLAENLKIDLQAFHLEMLEKEEAGPAYLPFHVAWPVAEPGGRFIRNDDGLSDGLDRLTCIGNAVVPAQAYPIFKAIAEIEGKNNEQSDPLEKEL